MEPEIVRPLKINGQDAALWRRADSQGRWTYAATLDRLDMHERPNDGLSGWVYTQQAAIALLREAQ